MGRIILRSRIISGFLNQRLNNGQAIKLKEQENEKEVIKILKKKLVEEDDRYVEIK